jgi:MFS superfamily sulfate permease-like transporter
MGGVFVILGASGWLDRVAKIFPKPIIRGIQLSVGLLFCQLAWNLVTAPPTAFGDHTRPLWWLVGGTVAVITAALILRRHQITLILVTLAAIGMVANYQGPLALGPSSLELPHLSVNAFVAAAVALVLPQLPLTFANSCLATADAARTYFGSAANRVRAGRLALSLGVANLLAGFISGMPVCHGAGRMTAHRSFGARTGGAPIVLGTMLLMFAFVVGGASPRCWQVSPCRFSRACSQGDGKIAREPRHPDRYGEAPVIRSRQVLKEGDMQHAGHGVTNEVSAIS